MERQSNQAQQSKSFVISTAESRYIKPLLQALIEDNSQKGWKETLSKEKYDLKWVGSSIEDEELCKILNQEKKVILNRFPGIQGLCHKDVFNRIMSIGQQIDENIFDFVPPQFTFPQDEAKFHEYYETHSNQIFIAKPVASSEGNSIVLFQSLSEIPSQLGAEMVVQRYIHNPLLIDGLKFDLRIYVVITQINPIQAFICDEGLARFCTEKYERPTKENFKKFFMHLTNYSINKHHEEYKESSNILESNDDTKRTLASLFKTLEQLNVDTQTIQENIKRTCTRTLSVYGPIIEHGVAVATNMKPLNGKYFQIMGFDLLIDENLQAHLLEINDHPSLNIFLEKDYMGGGMGKSLSEIDLYVKKRVVGDAIKLTKKSSQEVKELQEFRSLTKVYPDDSDNSTEVSRIINKFREIYYQIAPVKSKLNITSSNFEKIIQKYRFIKNLQISSIDLSLLFQKIGQGQKAIEFLDFIRLLYALKDCLEQKEIIQSEEIGQFVDQFIT